MSPLEQAVLIRKLRHLDELLQLLEAESGTPLERYLQDRRQQLLVQGCGTTPQSYADTFLQAGQQNLIPMDLAQNLVPAAGLRNRLVHDYEAIDPQRVHAAIPIALADLRALQSAVTARVRI